MGHVADVADCLAAAAAFCCTAAAGSILASPSCKRESGGKEEACLLWHATVQVRRCYGSSNALLLHVCCVCLWPAGKGIAAAKLDSVELFRTGGSCAGQQLTTITTGSSDFCRIASSCSNCMCCARLSSRYACSVSCNQTAAHA